MNHKKMFSKRIQNFLLGRLTMLLAITVLIPSCKLTGGHSTPQTLGELYSGYTYIPLDPSKVQLTSGKCNIAYSQLGDDEEAGKIKLLKLLPDNATRMSTETSDISGNISYGTAILKSAEVYYKLTADYVNSDTVNKPIWISHKIKMKVRETNVNNSGKETTREYEKTVSYRDFTEAQSSMYCAENATNKCVMEKVDNTDQYIVKTYNNAASGAENDKMRDLGFEEYNIPIYVGIGLRIVAEGKTKNDKVNLSGIGVIGIEAENNNLSGTLTVQTLGVNGQAVSSALPVQSELNRTTSNNAFVAIGSIKSMLHQPDTIKYPRVVGLYLPLPGNKSLVNALISELSREPVTWCPNGYEK